MDTPVYDAFAFIMLMPLSEAEFFAPLRDEINNKIAQIGTARRQLDFHVQANSAALQAKWWAECYPQWTRAGSSDGLPIQDDA